MLSGGVPRRPKAGEQITVDLADSKEDNEDRKRGREARERSSKKRKADEEERRSTQKRKRRNSPGKKGKKIKKGLKPKGRKKEADGQRKRRRRSEGDSSSSEDEEEDSSSSGSSSSSMEGSDSSQSSDSSSSRVSEAERRDKQGKKKKARRMRRKKEKKDDWQLLAEMWPLEARPARLQDKKVVARWSIGKIMEFKKQYEMEAERQGVGIAVFRRDKKRRIKKYKAMKDNGEDKLHPARFERMPFADPKTYWGEVPVKREEIYRHVKLDLYGAQGQVSEATIVRSVSRFFMYSAIRFGSACLTLIRSALFPFPFAATYLVTCSLMASI
jgi:hypothetical protein